MLMNIDVPRQYAPLEVNALALLTLQGIESRGPARRKRKYARDSVAFLFLRRQTCGRPNSFLFHFSHISYLDVFVNFE